jgi:hypothetical protein
LVAQNSSREFLLDLGLGAGLNIHKENGRNWTEESASGRNDAYDGAMGVEFGARLGYRNWAAPVYITGEFGLFRHGLNRTLPGQELDIVYFQRYVAPGVLVSLFGGLQFAVSAGFSIGEERRIVTDKRTTQEDKTFSSDFLSSGSNLTFNAYSITAAYDIELTHNQGIVLGVRHFSALNTKGQNDVVTTRATNLIANYRVRF